MQYVLHGLIPSTVCMHDIYNSYIYAIRITQPTVILFAVLNEFIAFSYYLHTSYTLR